MKYTDLISENKAVTVEVFGLNLKVSYNATKVNRYLLENRSGNDFDYIDETLSTLIIEWDLTDENGEMLKTDTESLAPLHSGLKNAILLAIIEDSNNVKKK